MVDADCDDREVVATLSFYNSGAFVNESALFPDYAYRNEEIVHDDGCGSVDGGGSFSSTNPHPKVHVCVWARNWISESSGDCAWSS